jgi:aminocarboxymuconate-semialdehyde decarboxylase
MMKGFGDGLGVSRMGRRNFVKLGAAAGAMIAFNARRARAQNGAGQPGSIDVHTHWAPEAYSKALAELVQGGAADSNPLNFDLDKRRTWMDQHGVRMHVLTISGRMPWQWVPPDVGATLAQILNDAAIQAHTAFPDRFLGGIEMSIRDPKLALKELNRVAGKPGMRAVHLPNSFEGKDYLFEPAYEPLLARCEELGYPLLFHPMDGDVNYYSAARLEDPLSEKANLPNTLGFPFEHATTAAKFIITGTLDRHPKLEIVLPHSGGIFPYIAGRIHHDFAATAARGDLKLQHSFPDYLRRFHYDTLTFYPETLRFLINKVGSDRVVIGTDNYAIMDVEYPNALVEQLKLPAADHDRILRGNAMRLLHL